MLRKRARGAENSCGDSYQARKLAFSGMARTLASTAAMLTGVAAVFESFAVVVFAAPGVDGAAGTVGTFGAFAGEFVFGAVATAGSIARGARRVMEPLRVGRARAGERAPLGVDIGVESAGPPGAVAAGGAAANAGSMVITARRMPDAMVAMRMDGV